MRTEHSIPLFLWVAAAVVAHAVFGGGATEVGSVISERIDVATFARDVSKSARIGSKPTEVVVFDATEETVEPEKSKEEKNDEAEAAKDEDSSEETLPKPPKEKKKPEPKKPEVLKEPEKKPDPVKPPEPKPPVPLVPPLTPPPPPVAPPPPPPPPTTDKRVAIKQQAKPDQEDNPDARHIANEANKVDEEMVARNTSADRNDPDPSPPRNFSGADQNPGDSDNDRSGHAEEAKGDPKGGETKEERAAREAVASKPSGARSPNPVQTEQSQNSSFRPEAKASQGQAAKQEIEARPDTLRSPSGSDGFVMAGPRPEQKAQKAQKAQKRLPPLKRGRDSEMLGFGSLGLTANGVNLNLTPQDAAVVVGRDQVAEARAAIREKRLAQHRGSFKNLGRDKWKAATENYVAVAKLGNQTALNAARVPFANYLNEIHQRIHPVFAEGFLASLSSLPAEHPLNRMDMATNIEIALDPADGRIVRMGVTQSSGVSMFDYGALESIEKAGPFGPAPSAILSSDGRVYLHWEFHREPNIACSNQNARPMILNIPPTSAPPVVAPPPPDSEGGERTGEVPSSKSPSG